MSAYSPFLAELLGTPASAEAQPWPARLVSVLAWPFRTINRTRRLHRTEQALRELDNRTLADIGLHRSQIGPVTTYVVDGAGLDPRRVLR